jgi:hypothetical protein
MLLAVPLTVVLKIVWEAIPFTRPLARLMAEHRWRHEQPSAVLHRPA